MKNKKISIVSAIMVVLFLSTLSMAQVPPTPPKQPIPPKAPRMNMMHNMKAMFEKLNLTDAQKDQFQKLKLNFEKQMIDLRANLQKSELELKEIQNSDNINRSDVINAVKNISEDKAAIAVASANHRMDMYDILTPDQRKVWKEMKKHHMPGKMMMRNKIKNKVKKNFKKRMNG